MPQPDSRQRIGIFGGTFDPIHTGHLLIAEQAREALELDEVHFVPAARSPLKLEQAATEDRHRLEMVRLAVMGNPHFIVDDRELRRGGTSFTVDTLREIRTERPEDEIFFLMGADSLASLAAWHQPQEICKLAFVVVLARGGLPLPEMSQLASYLPAAQLPDLKKHFIDMPQVEISASDIRRRVKQGRSIRYLLHPTTAAYIAANRLYS